MNDKQRRAAFALACAGMLVFGIVLTSLGTILPEIIARFDVTKAQAGSLFTLLSFGVLVGSLVFGPWVDRSGYRWPLTTSLALVAIGLELIAFGDSLSWLRAGVMVIGFAGGILNGGVSALVADITTESKAAGLSLLGAFFGVGAVGVPFALSALTGTIDYTKLVAFLGAVTALPIIATLTITLPVPKQMRSVPVAQIGALLRERPLLLMGAMLFLQSGMEITIGGWSATFAREELALDARAALLFLSLYWLGMMTSRLALGALLKRMSSVTALFTCISGAFAGATLLLTTGSVRPAAVGIFLVGAGFGGGFPIILGWVGDRYAAFSGTAFSIALTMALTGGMLFPYLTGVIGASAGLRNSLLIVPAALIGSALLLTTLRANRLITLTGQ